MISSAVHYIVMSVIYNVIDCLCHNCTLTKFSGGLENRYAVN